VFTGTSRRRRMGWSRFKQRTTGAGRKRAARRTARWSWSGPGASG